MAVCCTAFGCSPTDRAGEAGLGMFGHPKKVALLDPFQGVWKCDRDRTYAVWKKQGKADWIELQKKAAEALRGVPLSGLVLGDLSLPHPDVTVNGNIIVARGRPSAQYDLFALHSHDKVICGKAWHHEDRHDPGDMSKAWVRLERVGDEFHLHIKSGDEADPDDAEVTRMPTLVDAKVCETTGEKIESQMWATYVFVR
jgi:hypothetical protein